MPASSSSRDKGRDYRARMRASTVSEAEQAGDERAWALGRPGG